MCTDERITASVFPYQVALALCFEMLIHHSLTAAPRGRPWWPDKEPNEGIGQWRARTLGQGEESRSHPATEISPALITE